MDVRVGLRRRLIPENVSAGDQNTAIHQGDPLVEKGLVLYQELELSGFQDRSKLQECANCFLLAAESGCDEAVVWIRTFLESLPVSNTLPSNTLDLLRWFAKASESEKQVRRIARRMFLQISDGGKPIAKSKIEESIGRLFGDRPDAPTYADFRKASSQLKSSVTTLLNASLVLADADEVPYYFEISLAFGNYNIVLSFQIPEEIFVQAALKYAKGKYLSPEFPSLTPDKLEDFKKANFVKRVCMYQACTALYN